jgi:hypothetical protein
MINEIVVGISKKLGELFPTYQVNTDKDVKQGLTPPSFYIQYLKGDVKPGAIMKVFRSTNRFVIVYFPQNEGSRIECLTVAEKLKYELRDITLPDGKHTRGTDIDFDVNDGVLHLFVRYNYNEVDLSHEDEMDGVETTIATKGDT